MNKIHGRSVGWLIVAVLAYGIVFCPANCQPTTAESKLLGRWHNGDGFEMEFRRSGAHIIGCIVKVPSGWDGRQTTGCDLFSGGVVSGQQVKGLWAQSAGSEYPKLPDLHVPATISFKDNKTLNIATLRVFVGSETHKITGEVRNARWLKDRIPVTYNWTYVGPAPVGTESLVTANDFKDHVLTGKGGKKPLFDRMDKDGDGCLSKEEIGAAMTNPEFRGKDAEAIVVITNNPGLSTLSDSEGHKCAGVSKDDVSLIIQNDRNKKQVMETMNEIRNFKDKSKGHLFGPGDSVDPSAVKQGQLEDCNFLSPLTSWANTEEGKKAIREMIKPAGKDENGNDQYTVTLHDPKDLNKTVDVTVSKPTESELINYAKGTEKGVWPSVIEKAYGKWRITHDDKGNEVNPTVSAGMPPQLGANGHITARDAIPIITGKRAKSFEVNTASQSQLDKDLTTAFTGKKPVMTAGIEGETKGGVKKPWYVQSMFGPRGGLKDGKTATSGLIAGHEYSVLNYDPQSKQVTVRNPYGSNNATNPTMKSKDGTFKMSLEDFGNNFSHYTLAK